MKNLILLVLMLSSTAFGRVANNVYRMGASGNVPSWGSLDLTQSGTVGSSLLGLGNGGTGIGTCASGAVLYSNGTTAVCDTTKISIDPTTGIVTLPQYSTGLIISSAGGQLSFGTADGTYLVSNIALSGVGVTVGGRNVLVQGSNSSNLKVIRGTISGAGSGTSGEGFSAAHNATGDVTITYSSAFSATPTFVCTPTNNTVEICAMLSSGSSASTTHYQVHTSAGVAVDTDINFIAIGLQ